MDRCARGCNQRHVVCVSRLRFPTSLGGVKGAGGGSLWVRLEAHDGSPCGVPRDLHAVIPSS